MTKRSTTSMRYIPPLWDEYICTHCWCTNKVIPRIVEMYPIDEITEHIKFENDNDSYYRVVWTGYPNEDTYERTENVKDCLAFKSYTEQHAYDTIMTFSHKWSNWPYPYSDDIFYEI